MKILTCVLLCFFWRSSPIRSMKTIYIGIGNQKPSQGAKHTEFEDRWFLQKLDHFNPTNNKTWKQRYQVNDGYYRKDGPIFLHIGGESPISNYSMSNRAWIHYAKKLNALCFQLEHRYYGKSHPTEDKSTENLVYLSSQQALADLAQFIIDIPKKYKYEIPNSAKWIVFGGSYAGSLAAWLRMKYPHLVFAAVSSSAPLLAKLDFKEYMERIEDALTAYSPECVLQIRLATQIIDDLLQTPEGQRIIHNKFRLCDPLEENKQINAEELFSKLTGYFSYTVQYRHYNGSYVTFETLCDIMVNNSKSSPLDRYADVNDLMLAVDDSACTEFTDHSISDKNISWNIDDKNDRQWLYQTCTEFGFVQTSNQNDSAFHFMYLLDNYVNYCSYLFGYIFNSEKISALVNRTNMMNGGLNVQGSRIIYVHGSLDPWRVLGITQTTLKNTVSIYINGTTHCENMYYPSETDLPQLMKAHSYTLAYLYNWLMGRDSNKITNIHL